MALNVMVGRHFLRHALLGCVISVWRCRESATSSYSIWKLVALGAAVLGGSLNSRSRSSKRVSTAGWSGFTTRAEAGASCKCNEYEYVPGVNTDDAFFVPPRIPF